MKSLASFGWTDELSQKWQQLEHVGLQPARVIADFGTSLKIALPEVSMAELSGNMAHYSSRENIPKVGDWVAVRISDNQHTVVEEIIPRRNVLARKVAGKRTVRQIIAANVDIAFVLLALDADFSVERLKRYLYQLSIDAIEAVIVLNKADQVESIESYINQVSDLGYPVIVCSALNGDGVDEIRARISEGRTGILLGSSGVGKSTLTNRLLGTETQSTQSVRASDSTGKHTTVHRELFTLPNGGMLIDSPGIRELQLWGTEENLEENFDDILALAKRCRYGTCKHIDEAGCAVRAALSDGTLDAAHYANYLKMTAELKHLKGRLEIKNKARNRKSFKNLKRQTDDEIEEMRDEVNDLRDD